MAVATPDFGFWKDGVLSKRQLGELCDSGILTGPDGLKKLCGESAIDLRIDGRAFELIRGSVKPSGPRYLETLRQRGLVKEVAPESDKSTILQTARTYLLPVSERIEKRAQLWSLECYGQATAKSSIGRLDVLARLIVDGAHVYEGFTPECLRGSTGDLFVEVTPITFPIRVRAGVSLTQLRLFKNSPSAAELDDQTTSNRVLASPNRSLTVSLEPALIAKDDQLAVAFKARNGKHQAIDLSKKSNDEGVGGTDPLSLWEPRNTENGYFKIEPDAFYILRSAELISVPRDIAVYCRASDEAVGEMRIHYAGFVHPRFGLDRKDGACGTPLIFEVRGHNVPVLLADRERMATLVLYQMSEPYQGSEESAYGSQTLKLSSHFNAWPIRAGGSKKGTKS
jgi:dCTP deaminase